MIRFITILLLAATMSLSGADKDNYYRPRRFLVLVDVSISMKGHAATLNQSVFDLVRTGFNDMMRPGDVYEIWTFNYQVQNGGLGPSLWIPERRLSEAKAASDFTKKLKFARNANMGEAVSEMIWASRDQPVLTVFLVSDGEARITGTPFDGLINEVYSYNAKNVRRAKKLFYTSFVLEHGLVTSWDVSSEVEAISLPKLVKVTQALDATVPPADPTKTPPKKTVGLVVGPVPADAPANRPLAGASAGSGAATGDLKPSPIRTPEPSPESKLSPVAEAPAAPKPSAIKPPEPKPAATEPAQPPPPVKEKEVTTPALTEKSAPTPPPPPAPAPAAAAQPAPVPEPPKPTPAPPAAAPTPAPAPNAPPAPTPANAAPPAPVAPAAVVEGPSPADITPEPVPADEPAAPPGEEPAESATADPQAMAAQFNPAERRSPATMIAFMSLLGLTAILSGWLLWKKTRPARGNSLITESMKHR